RVQTAVPGVEVADQRNGAGGRRPDRERGAGDAIELDRVRAQARVELLVATFADQVQVELAERGQVRVGVTQRERVAVGIADLELVAQRQRRPRDGALEDPLGGRAP